MKTFKRLFFSSVSVMILTIIHHVYGAVIYDTPFRLHIAFIALPVIALLAITYWLYNRNPIHWTGKVSFWLFTVTTFIFSIASIGLYEGGFNHLVKNVLFFTGASNDTFANLYPPPPEFTLPNDFLFEATGILQLLAGVYTLFMFIRYWNENKKSN